MTTRANRERSMVEAGFRTSAGGAGNLVALSEGLLLMVIAWLRRIAEGYFACRRNCSAEDGAVLCAADRRKGEPFFDAFGDRLTELLARLKEDVPFRSPRYPGHMLGQQTLPGIGGCFAAMPNSPNILQAAGLATIDTLGVRGGGLHTPDEWIEIPSLVERCQLLAVLIARLCGNE